jgi:hypothetical protein
VEFSHRRQSPAITRHSDAALALSTSPISFRLEELAKHLKTGEQRATGSCSIADVEGDLRSVPEGAAGHCDGGRR